ncbi:unnamed protein product [Arctia plantaginis]|uniref:Uncharacterized protein n=1 Tax=Arctia plantaginis TaxID=874455 RepID=A0A8S1A681_ARCPL|nr:unnamed protein product [Arctia plantaginis]
MSAEGAGGCVNKAFEGADDGFHTIDLRYGRSTNNDDNQNRPQAEPETEPPPSNPVEHKEDRALRCGWGMFRPSWLQRFRTAKWALFWLCWAGAIQGHSTPSYVNVRSKCYEDCPVKVFHVPCNKLPWEHE